MRAGPTVRVRGVPASSQCGRRPRGDDAQLPCPAAGYRRWPGSHQGHLPAPGAFVGSAPVCTQQMTLDRNCKESDYCNITWGSGIFILVCWSPGGPRDSIVPSSTVGRCCQATGSCCCRSGRPPGFINPGDEVSSEHLNGLQRGVSRICTCCSML